MMASSSAASMPRCARPPRAMRVAVVDIGSNSIKLLVAARAPGGPLVEVATRTLDVRISGGIGSDRPRLGRQAMEQGVAAVAGLVSEARRLGADVIDAGAGRA